MVCDKVMCDKDVFDKDVCVCARWRVTKMCVIKLRVTKLCVCVTKLCVKDGHTKCVCVCKMARQLATSLSQVKGQELKCKHR